MTTDLLLNYLATEDPERLLKIQHGTEEQAKTELELLKREIQIRYGNLHVLNNYDLLQQKLFLTELEEKCDQNGIQYLNNYSSQETLRQLAKHILTTNDKLVMFVNKEKSITGKIVNKLYSYKQKIPIARKIREKTSDTIHYLGMGEKLNQKSFSEIETLYSEFWVYQFSTGTKQYLLLSEEELESKEYIVQGSLLEFQDSPLIGSTLRLNTILSTIVVYSVKSRIPVFKTHKEVINAMKGINRESWMNALFTHSEQNKSFRHPALFETLISSFLLAAKHDYYLHLMIIGRKGTGKSTMEECLWEKFNETQTIVGCGQSTLRALVPSFKNVPPSPGALISASRVSVVDEFLRILINIEASDREHQLSRLNDLLENRQRTFSSGNGSVNGCMTAKFLAVTNPVWGTGTMEHLCEYVDESFLSRMFIWYQQEEHVSFVRGEGGVGVASYLPFGLFLSVFDYCQGFKCVFDEKRIKEVFERIKQLLSSDSGMRRSLDTFEARGLHHCRCLLDGVVKTRCVTSGDADFVARNEDYDVLVALLECMVVGWGLNYVQK